MEQTWGWWLGFNVFVLAMLALDLGVFQRRAHEIKLREALLWSVVWILVALTFNLGLWLGWFGSYPAGVRSRIALEFLTGYLIEKSLSVDNLFVFAVIFTYFAVSGKYQHKVLFYGILGALVFRAIFIFGGLWLIQTFHWTIYLFGVFLVFTGVKLGLSKEQEIEPEKNPVLRIIRRVLPVSDHYEGGRFFTRVDRKLVATPLLLVLLFLETTDVAFAADSIPAVFGVTHDAFIVYTSNVFAILGLRAIFFVLAAVMRMFHYLSLGLATLLVFIGGKMLVEAALDRNIPSSISLGIVALILATAIAASVLWPRKKAPQPD